MAGNRERDFRDTAEGAEIVTNKTKRATHSTLRKILPKEYANSGAPADFITEAIETEGLNDAWYRKYFNPQIQGEVKAFAQMHNYGKATSWVDTANEKVGTVDGVLEVGMFDKERAQQAIRYMSPEQQEAVKERAARLETVLRQALNAEENPTGRYNLGWLLDNIKELK